MDVVKLQCEFIDLVKDLLAKGMIDTQFKVIQGWTSERVGDPSFAIDVLNHYFNDSEAGLNNISSALEHPPDVDFEQLFSYAHQIKGACSWIGARKIMNLCDELQRCCEEKIIDGCLRCEEALKNEVAVLNRKLQKVVQLELGIVEANGRVPPILD